MSTDLNMWKEEERAFGTTFRIRPPEDLAGLGSRPEVPAADEVLDIWISASLPQYHEARARLRNRPDFREHFIEGIGIPLCVTKADIVLGPGLPPPLRRTAAEFAAKYLLPFLLDQDQRMHLLHCGAALLRAPSALQHYALLLCLGDSGAGKSSSLEILREAGHAILADDLLPFVAADREAHVLAGDNALRLHTPRGSRPLYRSSLDGKLIAPREKLPPLQEPVPVVGIVFVTGSESQVDFSRAYDRFLLLHRQLLHYVLPSTLHRARAFRSCGILAQSLHLRALSWEGSLDNLREGLERVTSELPSAFDSTLRAKVLV